MGEKKELRERLELAGQEIIALRSMLERARDEVQELKAEAEQLQSRTGKGN